MDRQRRRSSPKRAGTDAFERRWMARRGPDRYRLRRIPPAPRAQLGWMGARRRGSPCVRPLSHARSLPLRPADPTPPGPAEPTMRLSSARAVASAAERLGSSAAAPHAPAAAGPALPSPGQSAPFSTKSLLAPSPEESHLRTRLFLTHPLLSHTHVYPLYPLPRHGPLPQARGRRQGCPLQH